MEKTKATTIALVIICFIIGIVLGFFMEQILVEDEDEGGTWDIFYADLPYEQEIDPANFVDTIDNPYLPLNAGQRLIYEGDTEDGVEHIEVYNTNETKIIMGVTCTVVRDTVSIGGELLEDTYDWFAQDIHGNVWYFGENSREFEDGEWSTEGSWEAGVDGAYPGIVMLANPMPGIAYRQEYWEGEAEDMGVVVSMGESLTISYGSYDDLLVIRDWNPLEPDEVEHKYYAKGIGVIREEVIVGDPEQFDLIDITNV
ncbi:MAG: hypothetical protein KAJ51_02325 [Thermoplasmata archaeon]|nr:hypothetical protein [Thermoplasmata archaeon]